MFRGNHVFDLGTSELWGQKKPILLFGGMNGSGKTTLFEGVKLCLYGRYVKGYKLSESDYQEFLTKRVHRHAGLLESDNSSVSLEFEHVHLGKKSRYFVQRTWSATERKSETLTVLQNGKPLEGVPAEQLQDFLIDLIPLGLSKLFFFDGEQIQNLAEDDPNNRHLAEAFNTLLGLDILQHLEADIGIHLSRESRSDESKIISELSKLEKEIRSLSSELEEKNWLRAEKQNEIDSVLSQIDTEERNIAAQGGGYSNKRTELKMRREVLQKEITIEENRIRELASTLLPFAIVPRLTSRLKDRLLHEEEKQKELQGQELLFKTINELVRKSESEDFWLGADLTKEQRKLISQKFISALRPRDEQNSPSDFLLLHQLSHIDHRKILNWVDEATMWVPAQLKEITMKLESRLQELRKVEESLSSVPPDETLAPFMQNINALHEKLGSLRKEANLLDESIRSLTFRISEIERSKRKSEQEENQGERSEQRIQLATKVRDALREFSDTVRTKKLNQLSNEFVEAFNLLSEKKNLIQSIRINSDDFSIMIYRKDAVMLPKERLSSAEKQIYAIAMLTALARVSGRPLPFIIDTPLGRLDSQHRRHLIENFFPTVSHQVVIFSTNTEIDEEYFELLEPSIAKAYLLSYDEGTESSQENAGYFWKPAKVIGRS